MDPSIATLREEYSRAELLETTVDLDPIQQFRRWFEEARNAAVKEPNAMTLATVGADGQPSARLVLLKDVDGRGFVFYSNRNSRKAREIAANARVALVFWWEALERQVRIEGRAEPVSDDEADHYFASRPRQSQLGAWASQQSEPIPNRDTLLAAMNEVTDRYEGEKPPRPPSWGGWRVIPSAVEFWQGRPSRLHDRLVYTRQNESAWKIVRLSP